jgi:catechol 2,3-dioxygenase-like lactoylglutathione lyase family enzyme
MNKITCICLGVRDMERSVRFYRDRLGFRTDCVEDSPRVCFFDTPGTTVSWGRRYWHIRCHGDGGTGTLDVLEGSPVDLKVRPKLDRYEKLRQELLASGDLVQDGDDGRLVKTVSFSTPSGAADFVLGGSNNGWIEWKDGDKQTLDALYRK